MSSSRSTIFAVAPFDGKCQNLQKTPINFCASSDHFRIKKIFILPSKSKSRSPSTIFATTPLDDKCQNLQMTPTHFCANSYCFRYLKFYLFNVKKVDQGHAVQFSQWHLSMANVKIYKCRTDIFAIALTLSEIYINCKCFINISVADSHTSSVIHCCSFSCQQYVQMHLYADKSLRQRLQFL